MLQLAFKSLTPTTQAQLAALQKRVDDKMTFAEKTAKAQSLWDNKSKSPTGKATFDEIKKQLIKMCVSVGICNYCEQNEANDIEHIFSKSFFPFLVFVWSNYLLACKQCNTALKLDKCFVFDNAGSIQLLIRGQQPTSNNVVFINPRLENPADYMIMNTQNYKFEINDGLSTEHYHKADKTIDVLGLNTRDTLIATRKAAAHYFYDRLERLVRILNAETIEQIHALLSPHDAYLGNNQTLDELKDSIKEGFKKDIIQHAHPSVWAAIKLVDSKTTRQWVYLFRQLPEALTW